MNENQIQILKEYIQEHEGLRLTVYKDSVGKPTIGFGHLLKPGEKYKKITLEQAHKIFDEDFEKHYAEAQQFPNYDKLTHSQKCAIVDLCFNMGQFWPKFPKFTKYLSEGKAKLAANELATSRYAKQVGRRAKNNIDLILGK